ncbi:MAG: BACON domain-containing protein [Paludibacteraceae bacterium]|nr:BACON domain-containing protein [Paludibacteraceae bacterium]
MSKISWGKPTILLKDLDEPGSNWKKIPTPVEDSTVLEIEEGEVLEAKIEGGETEDEKHQRNKANLTMEIRAAKDRHLIARDNDGVINHHFAVAVIPEDNAAPGLLIDRASMHATPSYSCKEGIKRSYKMGALVPDDESHSVKIGTINVTRSGDVVTDVTCTEEDIDLSSLSASPASLSFVASSAAAQTVTISCATAITSATPNRGWLTVTYTGTTVTVTAADNSNTSARNATVTVIANGETIKIPVSQAGAV